MAAVVVVVFVIQMRHISFRNANAVDKWIRLIDYWIKRIGRDFYALQGLVKGANNNGGSEALTAGPIFILSKYTSINYKKRRNKKIINQ